MWGNDEASEKVPVLGRALASLLLTVGIAHDRHRKFPNANTFPKVFGEYRADGQFDTKDAVENFKKEISGIDFKNENGNIHKDFIIKIFPIIK